MTEDSFYTTQIYAFIDMRRKAIVVHRKKKDNVPEVHFLPAIQKENPISTFNPLRPNKDLSQTSHCNSKGLSVSKVMRIEDMITQFKYY